MALNYQIALTSVWWNDDYQDVRRFSSAAEQKTYFKLDTAFLKAPFVNFDIKDLTRPRIVFKEPNRDMFDALNANYLIVKDNHASSVQKYFFYFIDKIIQDSGDVYIADCILDVWQTFQFSADFGRGLVDRAHLNRFKINSDHEIAFDWSENSPLFIEEKEVINEDKILKEDNRNRLDIPFITDDDKSIAKWLEENIAGWIYIFVEANKTYKCLKFESTAITESAPSEFYMGGVKNKGLYLPYGILCLPLYKKGTSKKIYYKDTAGSLFKFDSTDGIFRQYNSGYSYIYSKKILPINPLYKFFKKFVISSVINQYMPPERVEITNGDLIIKGFINVDKTGGWFQDVGADFTMFASSIESGGIYTGTLSFAIHQGNDDIDDLLDQYLIARKKPFTNWPLKNIEDLASLKTKFADKTLTRRTERNPKLYGAAYRQIRLNIANQGIASYGYNQLAAGNDLLNQISYRLENFYRAKSSLIPEVETLSLSPFKSDFFLYSQDYKAPSGAVLTSDFSIPFKNDVYEAYLANNKNFWLQNKTKWNLEAFKGIAAGLEPINLIKTGVGIGVDYFQTKYTINNMQNAPDKYSAGSGSVNFSLAFEEEIAYYADLYESPKYILERDDDYMYLYGFKYGRIEEFNNVVNIRAYFNYVRGTFDNISGSVSDAARKIISNSLAIGVRFWNVDRPTFNFNLDNLEHYVIDY